MTPVPGFLSSKKRRRIHFAEMHTTPGFALIEGRKKELSILSIFLFNAVTWRHEYGHVLFSLLRKGEAYRIPQTFPSSFPKALFPLILLLLIHSIRHPSPLLPSLSNSPRSPFKKSRYLPTYTLIPPKGVGKSYKSNFWTDGRGEGEPRKVFAFGNGYTSEFPKRARNKSYFFLKFVAFFCYFPISVWQTVFFWEKSPSFPRFCSVPKCRPLQIRQPMDFPPKVSTESVLEEHKFHGEKLGN